MSLDQAFGGLPRDPASLAGVVQGLMIHEHIASSYGVTLSDAQRAEAHVRPVEEIVQQIVAHDARPLTASRAPDERQVGVCRHFTLLHVAMLRQAGLRARARCGFGAYFESGKFLDHWVTEYWNEQRKAWVLVDSQLDAHQRALFKVQFDPLDVPRDQFVVAGLGWQWCRDGKADPEAFGILDMHGLWFIASNVIRDAAALNDHVMLPWDVWGAMTQEKDRLDLPFFDGLARLTIEPDRHFGEVRAIYQDPRVKVPGTVFNAVRNRPETL